MGDTMKLNKLDTQFVRQVESASGQQLNYCYQCGKCTAGCPIASSVEFPPHKIMRMTQLGLKKQVLSSPTIWLCLSCVTCTARCPKEVDLARVMDVLREVAIKEGVGIAQKQKIKLFENLFLGCIRRHGRLYEMGTLARYNMRSLRPFQDIELFLPLLRKGKLGLLPKSIRGKAEIERIFEKYLPKGI
jgi:heterodisulfide reductase subunit C